MKNNTISLNELKRLISESAYRIFETNLENDDTTETPDDATSLSHPLNKTGEEPSLENPTHNIQPNDTENTFDYLGTTIKNIAHKIKNPAHLEEANAEILKALSTGRVNKKYDFAVMNYGSGNKDTFDYFVSTLAALYKDEDEATKKNIRKVLFLVFPVYELYGGDISSEYSHRPSSFAKLTALKAGVKYDLRSLNKTIDSSYYIDIIADAIYESIDSSLEKYNPNVNVPFSSFLLANASNKTKDKLNSKLHQKTFSVGGQKYSLDEPIDNKGQEPDETQMDRITGQENEQSTSEVDAMKNFANALISFIQGKLANKPKLAKYWEFFNLFMEGNNLAEIADIMNTTYGNVRVIKKRMEDFVTEYVKEGYLQDYILRHTGLKVKFPDNKFALSVTNPGEEKKEAVEPVEFFNITGNDPKTGEPIGEWVPLTPNKGDSETTWFDRYGDLVNWSDKEEPASNPQDSIEDEEAEQLREHLYEAIQNYLKNKLNG